MIEETEYMYVALSVEQRRNLEKLADHLEKRVDPSRFSMYRYFSVHHEDAFERKYASISITDEPALIPIEAYSDNVCGTVACAIGHGPAAGIEPLMGERWYTYAHRCFGAGELLFRWLFESDWWAVDNTAKGAAARIRVVLESGIPRSFNEQMRGTYPLCYKVCTG